MRQLKLKAAGESVTMVVESCAIATQGNYPGMVFGGFDGTERVSVEMPKASADRQLEREGFDEESIVGQTVTVCREANNKDRTKPWWALYVVDPAAPLDALQETGAPPAPRAPARPSAPPVRQNAPPKPDKASEVGRLTAAYLALYGSVEAELNDRADPTVIQSATATIWICLDKRGLV